MILPSRVGGATTATVGYFEFDHESLASWMCEGLDEDWEIRRPAWRSSETAFADLAPSVPVSRYAIVRVEEWSLLLDNGPLGTDVGLWPMHAALDLGCRAIRAVCVEDDESEYPARMLDVFSPEGEPPLMYERSIAAANDGGRWVFEVSGKPYSFEDQEQYRQRIKSRRFTSQLLHEYLRCLGVPIDVEPDWPTALLVENASQCCTV